jgi:hypothetical protein
LFWVQKVLVFRSKKHARPDRFFLARLLSEAKNSA